MEELFRMILVRNAEAVREDDVVEVPDDTPMQRELQSLGTKAPKSEIDAVLRQFENTNNNNDAIASAPLTLALLAIHQALLNGDAGTSADLATVLTEHLGSGYGSRVESGEWAEHKNALGDALILFKLHPQRDRSPLNVITRALQTMRFIEQALTDAALLLPERLRLQLLRPLRASTLSVLAPFSPPEPAPLPPPQKPDRSQIEVQGERLSRINSALLELGSLSPKLFAVQSEDNIGEAPAGSGRRGLFGFFSFGFSPARTVRPVQIGARAGPMLKVATDSISQISAETRELVAAKGFDFNSDSVRAIAAGLDAEKAGVVQNLRPEAFSFSGNLANILRGGRFGTEDRFYWEPPWMPLLPSDAGEIPTTYGSVKPIGVGELLVVKQQILRYEAGEIAHIENIMLGEDKNRTHRRRDLTEEILVQESEIEREEERNLETSERFELSRESSEVIKEELEVEGSLKVKVKPSPAVTIEASAKVAYSNARETSRRKASEYAKEIVDKSVNRVSERIRKEETRRTVREIEEINEHGFSNVDGDGHVVGIYQWINKVYQAQIYRYGLRTMYDFMVPEPGAFLIDALEQEVQTTQGKRKPEPFTLQADNITEEGYLYYANKYHATDVGPPPRMEIVQAVSFTSSGGDGEEAVTDLAQKQIINIPEGYQAAQVHIAVGMAGYQLLVAVGQKLTLYVHDSGYRSFNLDLETGAIPVSMISNDVSIFNVNIEIVCRRTTRAMMEWRIRTHGEIKEAYLKELADYEDSMAQAAVNQGVAIEGRNPLYNRELLFSEMKKHCISILTNQHFDLFNGVEVDRHGVTQSNLAVAQTQGDYIRFFEHAFEWHLMSFVLYPYFWGRKHKWMEKVKFEDNDPEFMQFIKAGAARVLLPVRENFEAAVDHFMSTGEIWEGEPLPEITDPDYVPIVKEIQERTGAPGNEVAQGEPWLVRVPTRLVKLREEGSLPSWQQNDEGFWEPAPSANE